MLSETGAAMEVEGEEAAGQPRGKHIKKRALRNKALCVSFNEKELRDFVSGFHKRKKKRRKEATQQQEEAERRKRIEGRKRRKLERDYALYGGAPPPPATAETEGDEDEAEEEESEPIPSVSGTVMYDSGNVTVKVTTSEISREEEETEHPSARPSSELPALSLGGRIEKRKIPASKKKSVQKASRGRSRPKLMSKRVRRMGKKNAGKNRRH